MKTQPQYTLGKKERLKSRKLIEQLFEEGKSFSVTGFKIIYTIKPLITDIDNRELQAAFSVSSKIFKRGVDRNRIKRLMKEAYRLQKNDLSVQMKETNLHLVLFFIYTGKEIPDYTFVFEKMNIALKKLSDRIEKDKA